MSSTFIKIIIKFYNRGKCYWKNTGYASIQLGPSALEELFGTKPDVSESEALSTNESQPMSDPKQSPLSSEDVQQQAQPQFDRIKENVVLCKDALRRHEETIHCQCTPTKEEIKNGLACGEDCLNRQLFMECGPGCPSGKYCTNKRIQKREYAPYEIFCAGTKGFGLRATDQIKEGQFIIEYIGEIVNNSEKLRRSMIYSNHQHTYFMAYHNGTVIDATKKGNDSRLINHSCDPNAATQKWTVNDQLRIGLFALRTINQWEEITFNYQFESFREDQQKCFCGSTNCKGFIGTIKEDLPIVKSKAVEDAEVDTILSRGSMRNKDHLLAFNRLMIRVDHVENRQRMIEHLLVEDTDILRLFLATQGLPLIRNWLTLSGKQNIEDIHLQNTIMKLLSKLPLAHKSQADNCSIMSSLAQMADFHTANDLIVRDVVETIVQQIACQPNMEEQIMTLQPSSDPLVTECEKLQSNIQHVLKKWSALSDFKIPKREWRSNIDAIQPSEKPKGRIRTKDDFDVPNSDNSRLLPSLSSVHSFGQGPWSQVRNQNLNRNHRYVPGNRFKSPQRIRSSRFSKFPRNENSNRWRYQNDCKLPSKRNAIAFTKDKLSSSLPPSRASEPILREASSEAVVKNGNKEESESVVNEANSSLIVGKLPGYMGKLQIKPDSISSPPFSFRKVEIKQNSPSLTAPTSGSTENFGPILQRSLNEKATCNTKSEQEDKLRKLCAVMQPPVLQQSTFLSATAMDQYIKSLVECVNVLKEAQRVIFGENNSINESTASKQEDNAESDASNSLFVHKRRPSSSEMDDSPSKNRSLKKRKVREITPEDPRNAHAKHSALHQRLSMLNTVMMQKTKANIAQLQTPAITSDPRRARLAVDVEKSVREFSENIQVQDMQIKKERPWMPNMDISYESDPLLLCNVTTGGSISELPEPPWFNCIPARDADIAIATTGLVTPQSAVQEDEQFKRRATFKLQVAELVKKRIGELVKKPYTRFFPTENDYIKFVRTVTHKIIKNQNKDELMFSENVQKSTCQLVEQDIGQLMAQHLATTSVRAILPSDK
ncbi:SET domain-containing protein [Ditylenchus destructor]|uniref:SET domain-containing protein n=1 Tax=Ditylenchus destructor TaxID=166010 RepID=A0AAD4MG92_9BILA|nr:SET domain-containing protein [Ditylenchus destructor]